MNNPFEKPFIYRRPEDIPLSEQFITAMIREGVPPPSQLVIDGAIHRFRIDSSKDAGWYVVYPDGWPAGAFGNWKTGLHVTWHAEHSAPLSFEQDTARRRNLERAKADRDAQRAKKAEIAQNAVTDIWEHAGLASENHKYLKAKHIQPHGARITGDGRLIVPMFCNGQLTSVQYIDDQGSKLYHPGGAVRGAFFELGSREAPDRVFFAEGFATAASIAEATDQMTVVCFSAQNIPAVVAQFRLRFPTTSFVIAADNDASGTGVNYANQAAAASGAQVAVPPNVGEDFNDLAVAGQNIVQMLGLEDSLKRLNVIRASELPEEYSAPNEIIQDIIETESLAVLYGDSNSGKTYFALSAAYAVAEGRDFFGKRTEAGAVLYLATEAAPEVRRRIQAAKQYYGCDFQHLHVVQAPVNFFSSSIDAIDVIDACKQIYAQTGQQVKLIIGDTLSRIASGANENSGQDMGPVMDRFDEVAHVTGAAVLIVHHTGKDAAKGSRGWSGIRAHISGEFEVTESSGVRSMVITKQRSLPSKGQEIFFDLAVLQMGVTKFGAPATNCVAIPMDETAARKGRSQNDKRANTGMQMFIESWFEVSRESEEVNGKQYPCISKEALRRHWQAQGKQRNAYSETGNRSWIARLLQLGWISNGNVGYIITSESHISQCYLKLENMK